MQKLTLKIRDIHTLNEIQKSLGEQQSLTEKQQNILSDFLIQLKTTNALLIERTPLIDQFEIDLWNMKIVQQHLEQWEGLFSQLPGWDYSPTCIVYDEDAIEQLRKGIIMGVVFAPSMAYNTRRAKEGYEVHLKDDGTATFWFPTFEDAEAYPDLYNFKGSWKEAYLLLIETLKKGWPMEEFPEELKPLLKK